MNTLKVKFCGAIEKETMDKLRETARKQDRSVNKVINLILKQYYDENKK